MPKSRLRSEAITLKADLGLKAAKAMALDYLTLTKPKIFISIAITALMGLVLQPVFASYSFWISFTLVGSTILASAGAAVFNHYFERDTDSLMKRTRNRPLVKKTISNFSAICFGLLLSTLGLAWSYEVLGLVSSLWLAAGLFNYAVVYTLWLKRRSLWNVPIGGLSSSFAVLAGDTAVVGQITMPGLVLAILLFFWNPPHFWNLAVLYAEEYKRAGIPQLPNYISPRQTVLAILAHVVAVVACSVWLWVVAPLDWFYLAAACLSGGMLFWMNLKNLNILKQQLFRKNFIFSNMYLLILLSAIALDLVFSSLY